MDNNDRQQRQANPAGYVGPQAIIPPGEPAPYPGASGVDQIHPLSVRSPTAASSTSRTRVGHEYGYGYGGDGPSFAGSSIEAGALPYQPEYDRGQRRQQQQQEQEQQQKELQQQQPQSQQQRRPQQYPQYAPGMMYNVPAQQQAAPPSPFDPVQQYQPRQSAAIEVLSTQFGVPQQYYGVPGEGGPASAPAAGMTGQNVPPQYSSLSYTARSPSIRDALAPTHSAGMSDPSPGGSHGALAQGHGSYSQIHGASDWDNTYAEYQTQVKRTFHCIRDGRLAEGGDCLLRISKWLLGNAEALGLVRDDEPMHGERLKLWEEFNTAWLSILQRQKEMVQESTESGQAPRPPQSLMEYDFVESMGKELIVLCDSMEKHGLVDYQMGVWEEEIIAILTNTLDKMEESAGAAGAGAGGPGSAAVVRRQ